MTHVFQLPIEILIYVFAILPATDRKLILGVCKSWNRIISDDSSWKVAFEYHFGGYPKRRISDKWKDEYLSRLELHKNWNGNIQSFKFDPRISVVDYIQQLGSGDIALCSLATGVVTFCNPSTGKVYRNALFASRVFEQTRIGSIDMSNERIIIGCLNGRILVSKYSGIWSDLELLEDRHNSRVRFVKLTGDNFAISISTNDLKLWNLSTGQTAAKVILENEIRLLQVYGNYIYVLDNQKYYQFENSSGLKLCHEINVELLDPQSIHVVNDQEQYIVCTNGLYCRKNNEITLIELASKKTISCSYFSMKQHNIANSNSILVLGYSTGEVSIRILNVEIRKAQIITQSLHFAPVSTIVLNEFFMVTGSSDGTICISDTIEFKLIRNFNFRSRSLAEDKRVSNLIVSAKSIICSQGPLIVSWEFRQPPKKKSQRSRNKIKIPIQVPRNTSLNAEELYEEVVDALEEIKTEKSLKGKMNDRILKYNGDPNVHQMCEEDLLSYAMILSRDNLQEVPDQLSEQEMMDLALAISLSESNK